MKITVITVGKIKEKYLKDAIAEYSKRLSKYCKLEIVEVADEKTPDNASETVENQIRAKEGERILKYVKDDAYVVTLEIKGRQVTSEELADKIDTLGIQGTSHITFIIGGSIGLGGEVLARSDYALSFSKMTFPHQLMRVILLEQIYRSYRKMCIRDSYYPCTDDGSYGHAGMVTTMVDELVEKGNKYDVCVAIGPMIMMKFTCLTTKKYDIPTIVSMNPIMVDGTGMRCV